MLFKENLSDDHSKRWTVEYVVCMKKAPVISDGIWNTSNRFESVSSSRIRSLKLENFESLDPSRCLEIIQ